MTDVSCNDQTLIRTPSAARSLYNAPPPDAANKIGVEVEMPLYRVENGNVFLPAADEMLALQRQLKALGHDAQLEAAGVLEYASPALDAEAWPDLLARLAADLADFARAAVCHGLKISPYAILPTTTREEALRHTVPRERLQAALKAMSHLFEPEVLNIPLLTSGVQVSLSPPDPEAMYRMMKRAYVLTPLLIAALNSGSGYAENNPLRHSVHLRSRYYDLYGKAGGIAPSYLQSSSAEDFIRRHICTVFAAKMYFAYDRDGGLVLSTPGDVLTFEKLIARGLNTRSNYELAESFLYNDVKICNLRNASGDVLGKRLEIRAADSGSHQPASALILAGLLVPDGPAAEAFENVVSAYGFTGCPQQDAPLLCAARRAAVDHGGRFMDVPFGTGCLRDFAADVAGLVERYASGPEAARLIEILLTGDCDAKITASVYPTLATVTAGLCTSYEVSAPKTSSVFHIAKISKMV